MRTLGLLFMLLVAIPAVGSNSISLQLPTSSSNYQSDKFKTGDMDCSNAIGGTIH